MADDIADWLREEELKSELQGLQSAEGTQEMKFHFQLVKSIACHMTSLSVNYIGDT